MIEEETQKRVEELVAKRVAEELERRKDEIEAEVLRRVEEAKKVYGMDTEGEGKKGRDRRREWCTKMGGGCWLSLHFFTFLSTNPKPEPVGQYALARTRLYIRVR